MILKSEDIFKEIPDDPEHIMLVIPPEICTALNWEAGTELSVSVTNGELRIEKA